MSNNTVSKCLKNHKSKCWRRGGKQLTQRIFMRAVIQCLLVWHVSCFESLCHLFFQSSFLWSDKLLYRAIGHAKVSQKKFNAILPVCKQTWELRIKGLVWLFLGVQEFTSLKADIDQDISGGFAFSRYFHETFPWRKCSVKALVS